MEVRLRGFRRFGATAFAWLSRLAEKHGQREALAEPKLAKDQAS